MNTSYNTAFSCTYLCFGIAACLVNGGVLIIISTTCKFTKDTILLIGFIVPSLSSSVAYVYESVHDLLLEKQVENFTTRIICMSENMHISLYTFGETASPLVLLLMSLDRMLAMLSSKAYARVTPRTAAFSVLIIYMSALIELATVWIQCWWKDRSSLVSNKCNHTDTVGMPTYRIHVFGIVISSAVSIVLSTTSLVIMRQRTQATQNEVVRNAQMRREPMVTRRIAGLIIAAFFLQVLPMSVYLIHLKQSILAGVENFIWLPYIFSLIFNTLWCAIRQKEVKEKMKHILKVAHVTKEPSRRGN